jgi:hypothetical protein
LTKRVTNNKKFELHVEEQNIWLATWKAAAGGAKGPIEVLPIAYLRLPATSDISPPPIVITDVFIKVCNFIKTKNESKSKSESDFPFINVLEAIFDTLNLRLNGLIQEKCITNGEALLKSINDLEQVLSSIITSGFQQFPEFADRLAVLLLRRKEIQELKKKIRDNSSNQQLEIEEINLNKHPWLGWQQNPKLDWLLSGSWHDVDGLKAMYNSSEEYAESLLRIWTLLTFYWGSGAVWPKCTHKQGGDANSSDFNACGEPLLTITASGDCKKCGGNASWKCFRHGHDHICKKCLFRFQDDLIGRPGPHASTDIYDAVVDREVIRRGDTIYLLKNLESRKPPKIAPNWKTSKIILLRLFNFLLLKNKRFVY